MSPYTLSPPLCPPQILNTPTCSRGEALGKGQCWVHHGGAKDPSQDVSHGTIPAQLSYQRTLTEEAQTPKPALDTSQHNPARRDLGPTSSTFLLQMHPKICLPGALSVGRGRNLSEFPSMEQSFSLQPRQSLPEPRGLCLVSSQIHSSESPECG